ncbi:MAG: hypothetical protein ACFFE6_03245 [Candidatus Thorarchaeota archaeon]
MENGFQQQNREYRQALWLRDIKVGESHHPAFAWGRWIVFLCIVIMFLAALTGFIPQSLQQAFIVLWIAIVIFGGVLSCVGFSKSFDRGVYPLFAALVLVGIIMIVILYYLG